MDDFLINPYVKKGFFVSGANDVSTDIAAVKKLLALCPKASPTPLHQAPDLIDNIGQLSIKDERQRMGLGSFKATGAAYAIAKEAAKKISLDAAPELWKQALQGQCFVAASAGNHGLSVAAGARLFGAKAVIYLAETVPQPFIDKLKTYGAVTVIEGKNYEASMQAASERAEKEGWVLLSDSTWQGYSGGLDVMEGYLILAEEALKQLTTPPTHIFLQAGVGGFAAAIAAFIRVKFKNDPYITIVEPSEANVLQASIQAGKPVEVSGDVSIMGRLDCKVSSLSALNSLAKTANMFMYVSDQEVKNCLQTLEQAGFATSPSGGAGFAGLVKALKEQRCGLDANSHALIVLTESPTSAILDV